MKKWLICAVLFSFPFIGFANHEDSDYEIHFDGNYITTQELVAWYDQGQSMVVLDARSRSYFDGYTLPGAIWTPHYTVQEILLSLIPAQDSIIIVYCNNPGCPVSVWLATRLLEMGFTNVYEYAEGLDTWIEAGNPIVSYAHK